MPRNREYERNGTEHTPELEHAREVVLEQLAKWAQHKPNEPVYTEAGDEVVTRQNILDAVREPTAYGWQLVERWHRLAIEHILRARLFNERISR